MKLKRGSLPKIGWQQIPFAGLILLSACAHLAAGDGSSGSAVGVVNGQNPAEDNTHLAVTQPPPPKVVPVDNSPKSEAVVLYESRAAIFGQALNADERQKVAKLCLDIDKLYRKNKWSGASICSKVNFTIFGYSLKGRPLIQMSFGDPKSAKMTLIQCAIHGDELPSMPMCLNLINEVFSGKKLPPKEVFLVVQPLLNPDGMLEGKPQRPNLNGIDINRNFPTSDFDEKAKDVWQKRDNHDARKFPGDKANSEPETQALVKFINSTRPQKIISIHTPLGHLDLDAKGEADQERRAKFLAINMSKNSGNYTFKTFGFFPGSLGNFAGREMQIPVYTLELPPGLSKPTVDTYWKRFRVALWRAIDFDLDTGQFFED